jgi:F-type H+-transporting ATPase subunit gamma
MAKGIREIKRQIKSIQNTKQITKAMEMIAAARLRRSQEAAQSARPYAQKLREVIASIASASGNASHPMLQKRPIRKTGYVIITSDRGLAGGYNANLLRKVSTTLRDKHTSSEGYMIFVSGRKGRDFMRRRNIPIAFETIGLNDFPRFSDIKELAATAVKAYEAGTIDELVLVYNEFVSAISQRPVEKTLLPLTDSSGQGNGGTTASYEFEPSPEVVLEHILPRYAETLIYSAVLEGKASEFGARMTAMSNATKNATKLIGERTLQYNRARQASITQEITEIVAGANAQG